MRLHEKVEKRDGYIDKLRQEVRRLRIGGEGQGGDEEEVRGDEGQDLLEMDMLEGEEEDLESSLADEDGDDGEDGEDDSMRENGMGMGIGMDDEEDEDDDAMDEEDDAAPAMATRRKSGGRAAASVKKSPALVPVNSRRRSQQV